MQQSVKDIRLILAEAVANIVGPAQVACLALERAEELIQQQAKEIADLKLRAETAKTATESSTP